MKSVLVNRSRSPRVEVFPAINAKVTVMIDASTEMRGTLLDVSQHGFGVQLDEKSVKHLTPDMSYHVSISLPFGGEIQLYARVVNILPWKAGFEITSFEDGPSSLAWEHLVKALYFMKSASCVVL